MKRTLLVTILILFSDIIFSQELLIVIAPFEVREGSGFSKSNAEDIEYLFLNELSNYKNIKALDQSKIMFKETIKRMEFELSDWSDFKKVADFGKALNANAVVLGRIMTLGNEIIIAARINDLNTEIKAANNMEITSIGEVRSKLPAFTKEIVDKLPKPHPTNPFIGKWRSTIVSNGETLICIMDFGSDGTIKVERFDTNIVTRVLAGMRHRNEIKKGRGSGTYSFRYTGGVDIDISLTISGVNKIFSAIHTQGTIYSNPNEFEVESMPCEYYDGGNNDKYINDAYKIFNKM